MIESYLIQSSEGPARKYYRMSNRGRTSLEQWRIDWTGFRDAVDGVLNGSDHD
jgi:PadR family transcriptional regulator PadR